MIDRLHALALSEKRYSFLIDLIEKFRIHHTEQFEHDRGYLLDFVLTAALLDGQREKAEQAFLEMSENISERGIDPYFWCIDRLAYHGNLSTLIAGLKIAWPKIGDCDEIVPWAKDELHYKMIAYGIFSYLDSIGKDQALNSMGDESKLFEEMSWTKDFYPDSLKLQVASITGKTKRAWHIDAFRTKINPPDLRDLTWEFIGYLHWEKGVPFTRAFMQQNLIQEYIGKRAMNEFRPKPNPWDFPQKHSHQKKKHQKSPARHPLAPDRETLDYFAVQQKTFFSLDIYKVEALFEAIPNWLDFLVSRQLLNTEILDNTVNELAPLFTEVEEAVRKHPEGAMLLNNFTLFQNELQSHRPSLENQASRPEGAAELSPSL